MAREVLGGGGVPSGAIMAHDNDGSSLPSGFVLCDGNNGTPDLRSRYIRGASGTGDEGNTGGTSSVSLSTGQLSSHSHGIPADTGSSSTGSNALTENTQSNTISTNNTGGNNSHQNEPPFTDLRFMMKT